MAVSAYRRGLLKKHPLLGTSFLVDPTQATNRARFMELHAGANKAGRQGMLERLSGEYRQFGLPHVSRLYEIASAKAPLAYGSTERNELEQEEIQRNKYLRDRAFIYNAFLGA